VIWPAIAARIGLALDRRGTHRLAQFISNDRHGARIQLSGGYEAIRLGEDVVLRRVPASRSHAGDREVPLVGDEVIFGEWRFRRVGSPPVVPLTRTHAALPLNARLEVRAWRPGDRMVASRRGEPTAARRVKRFFSDAHVAGPEREGWPVVLADDQIVWIPGIGRSDAATVRSGRPVVHYACERFDR
jgi:tRNA(Ile)-lysidine synthase